MAEGLWLLIAADSSGNLSQGVDGIEAIIINEDEGSSVEQLMLTVNQQMVRSNKQELPDNYFNQSIFIGDLVTGTLSEDQSCYIFASSGREVIYQDPIP